MMKGLLLQGAFRVIANAHKVLVFMIIVQKNWPTVLVQMLVPLENDDNSKQGPFCKEHSLWMIAIVSKIVLLKWLVSMKHCSNELTNNIGSVNREVVKKSLHSESSFTCDFALSVCKNSEFIWIFEITWTLNLLKRNKTNRHFLNTNRTS